MFKTVIVIPIYKEEITPSEIVSLKQVKKVLKDYDLVYIAPIKMKQVFEKNNYLVEYWPDDCFKDITSYSKLLLTKEFYERFVDYEYMLIYQLDGFVFYDRLMEFCSMEFDYIGAPIPFWGPWRGLKARVGNGGVSLRRVKSCIKVVEMKEYIYSKTGREEEFESGEDRFFAYCGYDKNIEFQVPDKKTALIFCIEGDVMKCHKKLSENNLPFACHGWSKYCYWEIWKPYIKQYITNITDIENEIKSHVDRLYEENRVMSLIQYLMERLFRKEKIKEYNRVMKNMLPNNRGYILWGTGKAGGVALKIFLMLNRRVEFLLSRDDKIEKRNNIDVIKPSEKNIKQGDCYLIVAVISKQYIEEIELCLKKYGINKGEDYLLYTDIIEAIAKEYYVQSIHKWGHGY